MDTIGAAYTVTSLAPENGVYKAQIAEPKSGYSAFFVELTYPGGFKLTTEVSIVPDKLPHKWSEAAAKYQATKSVSTRPPTSVSRKSRPE